jgi:hypothetical protein
MLGLSGKPTTITKRIGLLLYANIDRDLCHSLFLPIAPQLALSKRHNRLQTAPGV